MVAVVKHNSSETKAAPMEKKLKLVMRAFTHAGDAGGNGMEVALAEAELVLESMIFWL